MVIGGMGKLYEPAARTPVDKSVEIRGITVYIHGAENKKADGGAIGFS